MIEREIARFQLFFFFSFLWILFRERERDGEIYTVIIIIFLIAVGNDKYENKWEKSIGGYGGTEEMEHNGPRKSTTLNREALPANLTIAEKPKFGAPVG